MTGWSGVDWSRAPSWATHWAMDGDGKAFWYGFRLEFVTPGGPGGVAVWSPASFTNYDMAPDFGYTGHPRDSMTVRPQTKGQDT